MKPKVRTALVGVALLGAALLAVPGTLAYEIGTADGTKICEKVGGLNACVAHQYDDCEVWLSAGVGGCLIDQESEPEPEPEP